MLDPDLLNRLEQLQHQEYLVQGDRDDCGSLPGEFCPEGIKIRLGSGQESTHYNYLPLTAERPYYLFSKGKPQIASSQLIYPEQEAEAPYDQTLAGPGPRVFPDGGDP